MLHEVKLISLARALTLLRTPFHHVQLYPSVRPTIGALDGKLSALERQMYRLGPLPEKDFIVFRCESSCSDSRSVEEAYELCLALRYSCGRES